MIAPLRRLYDWTLSWADTRWAVHALASLSFAESSFFPMPPDVLLVPLCLGKPAASFYYASITTVASVIGGVFGYMIGFFAFETIGMWILGLISPLTGMSAEQMNEAATHFFKHYGVWIVAAAALTPIPYKVFTITAGFLGMNLLLFIVVSVLGRGARFFAVAVAIYWFGEPVKGWIDRNFNLACWAFLVLLIGGFFAIHYFF